MSDLFTSGDQTALFEDDDQIPVVDPNKDYFEELVGEGKKFKDPKELARAKAESDAFILRLQNEAKELRKSINQQVTLEAVLDKLNKPNSPNPNTPPVQPSPEKNGTEVTPEQLEALLERKLTEREKQTIHARNEQTVSQTLVQAFGSEDVVKAEIRRKASELDLTPAELKTMAQQRPKAFLKLMGVEDRREPFSSPVRGSHNTPPSSFNPSGEKTQKYYDNLKATNPKLYWSPKIQNERHLQAMKLGQAFFTT